nr:hypothetical protein [Tanacetum cinerariifolium]
RERYFEIQDLKAQLQDKGIAISELKKLIEKLKGKSVDTKFEKSSVIRQPNAFKRVIPTTSVSRPQVKSNPPGDRVLRSNSLGKKLEEPHRNVKLSKNKTSVTACSDSLNAKTLNVKSVSAINNVRKLHERFEKIYKWSYIKFTPSGYMWKPKSKQANGNPNVSMPLGNASRTANVKDTMTSRRSIVSNTPLSSNSFAAHRDCSIHRRLWVLKAHDGKSQLLINFVEKFLGRRSTVSNTSLSSNSFAARRDCPIHRRLWVLKAHDGKSQASN